MNDRIVNFMVQNLTTQWPIYYISYSNDFTIVL